MSIRRTVTLVAAGIVTAMLSAGAASAATSPQSLRSPGLRVVPWGTGTQIAGQKVIFPTRAAWKAGIGNTGRAGRAIVKSASSAPPLIFWGGVDGIGVTTGPPRVYVVFWGSQWGTPSTGTDGYQHLTGDPSGIAPRLQAMLAGLGTNGELWSGVMTQYCEAVATGSSSCPTGAPHVGYPTGGAIAGVWVDTSVTAPTSGTDHQIAVEAVAAAGHFGNTTATSNRSAQYVIVSPKGTHPGGFNTSSGNFCAWHDWNGDTTLNGGAATSTFGDIAFTNMPYLTDLGASCGANYVNSGTAGTLDGVTIVEGHEYAETITDQNPAGGWLDRTGYENGDKCAWVGVGGTGGAQNVAFATGSFAMQATWSNSNGSCSIANPIFLAGNSITVTNPGTQSATVGAPIGLQISATDSAGAGTSLTYSATGLPAGLSISSTTGLISGTPTSVGSSSVTVTVTDATGAVGTTTFTIGVVAPCVATQAVANPGFETGVAAPWSISATRILNGSSKEPPLSGTYDAWLGGQGSAHTDTVSQSITIPASCTTYQLSYWLHIDTAETTTRSRNDTLTVKLGTTTLATYSNLNKTTGYILHTFNISSFAGKVVVLTFTAKENSSRQTSFVIDDVTANVS